ncbi:MAG: type I glutamate--ammonia ligase [Elusimicrobia bacterium]|nr:type I glutamate--ammonia ligase [Elusimicrobiota bacterium]
MRVRGRAREEDAHMLGFRSAAEVRRYAAKNGIEQISLFVSDIDGRLRNVTIPAGNFTDKLRREGVGIDASNLGFATVDKSDMLIKPDLGFGFADPVEPERKTLSFLCDILNIGTQESFDQDLRHIVAKAVSALRAEGAADEVKIGLELEFYVLDELHSTMTVRETSYRVESGEIASPPGGAELYRIFSNRGYFRSEPNDHHFVLRNEICAAFKRVGLEVKYHHHEVGSSQAEIEFRFQPIGFMADATALAKHICHRIARKHGKIITFIPKLIPGEAGNGMHIHQFLLKRGRNVFHDEKGLYKLSRTALGYIGGLLSHPDSLVALTNPTTNSYRRLIPGFEAPVKAVFAEGNRSAAIRIPGYVNDPGERRIEFRTIDATCNPYLAYAAMIMAGLDGIRRKIDPVRAGFGPYETNLYKLPKERLARIKSFPANLETALAALRDDRGYLTYRGVFPDDLLDKWIATKTKDIMDMRQVPHPWEIARYYDI